MHRSERLHVECPRQPLRPKHTALRCRALQVLADVNVLELLARYDQVVSYRLLNY